MENPDICIIGSEAAGAGLAKELVEAGKKVVLIERGGYHEGKDMNQREVDMMPLLWKNVGFNFVDSLKILYLKVAVWRLNNNQCHCLF